METGRNNVIYECDKVVIEYPEMDIAYYADYQSNKEQFMLGCYENDSMGPWILTVEKNLKIDSRAILRTKDGDDRFVIPAEYCTNHKSVLTYTTSLYPKIQNGKIFKV